MGLRRGIVIMDYEERENLKAKAYALANSNEIHKHFSLFMSVTSSHYERHFKSKLKISDDVYRQHVVRSFILSGYEYICPNILRECPPITDGPIKVMPGGSYYSHNGYSMQEMKDYYGGKEVPKSILVLSRRPSNKRSKLY